MQRSTKIQAQATEISQKDTYRLIVFDPAGTAVLLETQGNEYRLPKVDVPQFTRPAREVTEIVRNSWNLSSVFLFSGVLEESPGPSYFAVLESRDGLQLCPHGMNWFTIHHATSNLLFSTRERHAVESSYRKAVHRIPGQLGEPFCKLGWMRDLEDWIQDAVRPRGIAVEGFEQFNACETSSLIRFDTSQQPIWFKAVGEPNLHEYGISLGLARLLPKYVPSIVATRPEWHGWLMADGGGLTLNEIQNPSAWETAVVTLADLQIDSIPQKNQMLETGCRDLRLAEMLELVDPFFDTMADLMAQQTKVPPPVLTREELSRLAVTLKHALRCLGSLQIPDTLGHRDFNPGNIIIGPERCIFIDWAEAHISHPFLTFEYLMSHLRKAHRELIRLEGYLKSCYSNRWQPISSLEHISQAFLFSPLVAVFAYAGGGTAWRSPDGLRTSHVPGYLRSLTRRIKQEAELLQRRRVECPN